MPSLSNTFTVSNREGCQHLILRQSVDIVTFRQHGSIPMVFTTKDGSEEKHRKGQQPGSGAQGSWVFDLMSIWG